MTSSRFGYFWNKELSLRNTGALCPESPARYDILAPNRVFTDGIKYQHCDFTAFNPRILNSAHDAEYIQHVRDAYKNNIRYLDARDTVVTEDIFDKAVLSASAGCHAVDKVMQGELMTAFCVVRPPGHHANRIRGMGFCVFNNVAVAAKYTQDNYDIERVMIVDWDVHPGNGTQEILYEDPSVLTISLHQADLFQGTGEESLTGRGEGEGFNQNVAFPGNIKPDEYIKRFEEVIGQSAQKYKPELLLISAGFDAHKNDHVSQIALSDEDFAKMTDIILNVTQAFTKGRTVSVLEGGYNIGSLLSGVRAHCGVLSQFAETQSKKGNSYV